MTQVATHQLNCQNVAKSYPTAGQPLNVLTDVSLEMSLPNRAGILTPVDGLDEGEQVTMLVMPVMLNN